MAILQILAHLLQYIRHFSRDVAFTHWGLTFPCPVCGNPVHVAFGSDHLPRFRCENLCDEDEIRLRMRMKRRSLGVRLRDFFLGDGWRFQENGLRKTSPWFQPSLPARIAARFRRGGKKSADLQSPGLVFLTWDPMDALLLLAMGFQAICITWDPNIQVHRDVRYVFVPGLDSSARKDMLDYLQKMPFPEDRLWEILDLSARGNIAKGELAWPQAGIPTKLWSVQTLAEERGVEGAQKQILLELTEKPAVLYAQVLKQWINRDLRPQELVIPVERLLVVQAAVVHRANGGFLRNAGPSLGDGSSGRAAIGAGDARSAREKEETRNAAPEKKFQTPADPRNPSGSTCSGTTRPGADCTKEKEDQTTCHRDRFVWADDAPEKPPAEAEAIRNPGGPTAAQVPAHTPSAAKDLPPAGSPAAPGPRPSRTQDRSVPVFGSIGPASVVRADVPEEPPAMAEAIRNPGGRTAAQVPAHNPSAVNDLSSAVYPEVSGDQVCLPAGKAVHKDLEQPEKTTRRKSLHSAMSLEEVCSLARTDWREEPRGLRQAVSWLVDVLDNSDQGICSYEELDHLRAEAGITRQTLADAWRVLWDLGLVHNAIRVVRYDKDSDHSRMPRNIVYYIGLPRNLDPGSRSCWFDRIGSASGKGGVQELWSPPATADSTGPEKISALKPPAHDCVVVARSRDLFDHDRPNPDLEYVWAQSGRRQKDSAPENAVQDDGRLEATRHSAGPENPPAREVPVPGTPPTETMTPAGSPEVRDRLSGGQTVPAGSGKSHTPLEDTEEPEKPGRRTRPRPVLTLEEVRLLEGTDWREEPRKLHQAVSWLMGLLQDRDDGMISVEELDRLREKAGITPRTLQDARRVLRDLGLAVSDRRPVRNGGPNPERVYCVCLCSPNRREVPSRLF